MRCILRPSASWQRLAKVARGAAGLGGCSFLVVGVTELIPQESFVRGVDHIALEGPDSFGASPATGELDSDMGYFAPFVPPSGGQTP
jgi:hypothetical protein